MIQKIDKTQIEAGISAIIDPEISIANNAGEVPNEFNGYISSFGAQVIQSGLAPAVVFFEDKDANSNEDRGKIIKAIMQIMGLTRGSMYNHIKNMRTELKKMNAGVNNFFGFFRLLHRFYPLHVKIPLT